MGEPFVAPEPAFFDGNKRVRLGRSKDQDGKSNIWSIEPKMEVMEGEEDQPNQIFILGGVFAAVAASIPVFLALTKVLPDLRTTNLAIRVECGFNSLGRGCGCG